MFRFPFLHSSLQLLMFLLALFVLLFHCFIKPYKKETSNVVETLILLNLLLVAAVYLEAPQGQVAPVFVVILTLLPYLYAVGFLMWLAGKKMLVNINYRIIDLPHLRINSCIVHKLLCIHIYTGMPSVAVVCTSASLQSWHQLSLPYHGQ